MATLSARDVADAFLQQSASRQLDLADLHQELGKLAAAVTIESIDVNPAAIEIEPGDQFSGEATANVALTASGGSVFGEEVPVSFSGRLDLSGNIVFHQLHADLTPFSE